MYKQYLGSKKQIIAAKITEKLLISKIDEYLSQLNKLKSKSINDTKNIDALNKLKTKLEIETGAHRIIELGDMKLKEIMEYYKII